jgi:hypothetical protein
MTATVFIFLLSLTSILSFSSVQRLPSSVWPEKGRPEKQTQASSMHFRHPLNVLYDDKIPRFSKKWPVFAHHCDSPERVFFMFYAAGHDHARIKKARRNSQTDNLA